MLTYWYKRNSVLPRREFVACVRVWYFDNDNQYIYYEVTAPDTIMAYEVVRKHVATLVPITKFMVENIREVTMVWCDERKVPFVRVVLDNAGFRN